MWVAAYSAAQVQTLRRTELLASERDAALLKLETMGQDVAGLVATVDEQAGQLDQAAQALIGVQAARLADLEKAEADKATAAADRAQLAQELERTRQELAQARADAQHAAQIAEAGRELMRQELARLTDQVGELKAALYKRAEAPPPAVVVTPSPAG
jgi:ABC-type transporter Mla subunit MlaD